MDSVWVISLVFFGILGWLTLLSYLVFKEFNFLKQLLPGGDERALRARLAQLIEEVKNLHLREKELKNELEGLTLENLGNIQKLEILRYNPYEDLGGDQSFSLAMLDGKNNGIILTSLHTRSGTRVYAKAIINKVAELELSREEKMVLQKVRKN